MSLMPGGYDPMSQIFGNRGPSWLPQGQRQNPFGMPQGGDQQQPQGLAGLLKDPNFALALLANSRGQSFGQAIGNAGLQAGQLGQQREDADFQRQYRQAQMQKMLQPDAGNSPNSIQEFEYAKKNGYAGTFEQWRSTQGTKAEPPASIQEFNLAKEQGFTGTFFEYVSEKAKRSAQYPFAIETVNGVPTLVPRINPSEPTKPQPDGQVQTPLVPKPLSNIATESDAKRQLASATAGGTETGKSQATAQIDLPRMEDNAGQMLKLLDRLEKHPGRKDATGASSALQMDRLPGTNARDFVAGLKQVGGKQFLEAYNTLKGGGAITETEGTKAETAISTIQDRGQSEDAWLQALDDLRDVVNSGLRRARRKAQSSEAAPAAGGSDPLGLR